MGVGGGGGVGQFCLLPVMYYTLDVDLSTRRGGNATAASNTSSGHVLDTSDLVAASTHLSDLCRALPRIVVANRHPVIGTTRNGLICSLPHLVRGLPMSGTCSTIGRLPNIVRVGKKLRLTNRKIAIVLSNGMAALDARRLCSLLHDVPTDHVRGTRIVCGTPTHCRIHNTLVGVALGRSTNNPNS